MLMLVDAHAYGVCGACGAHHVALVLSVGHLRRLDSYAHAYYGPRTRIIQLNIRTYGNANAYAYAYAIAMPLPTMALALGLLLPLRTLVVVANVVANANVIAMTVVVIVFLNALP